MKFLNKIKVTKKSPISFFQHLHVGLWWAWSYYLQTFPRMPSEMAGGSWGHLTWRAVAVDLRGAGAVVIFTVNKVNSLLWDPQKTFQRGKPCLAISNPLFSNFSVQSLLGPEVPEIQQNDSWMWPYQEPGISQLENCFSCMHHCPLSVPNPE